MPGASPTAGERSGVNDSGPQKNVRMPTSWVIGTRSMACSRNGAIRSQSGGSVPKEKFGGMPSTDQAAASGSKSPTIIPPPSSR